MRLVTWFLRSLYSSGLDALLVELRIEFDGILDILRPPFGEFGMPYSFLSVWGMFIEHIHEEIKPYTNSIIGVVIDVNYAPWNAAMEDHAKSLLH